MEALAELAAHNEWANALLLEACSPISSAKLHDVSLGYDSVIGILNHFIQVENSFFELAHDRQPQWTRLEQLTDLAKECARIDRGYVEYANRLSLDEAQAKRFLVPWFGFEISLLEGVLQPMTHSHKHRADISMLLPRLGGNGIEMDFIQWLDEARADD
jgi:uncharacterized damage-inducible protein DinB